jgi:hypothetical protein
MLSGNSGMLDNKVLPQKKYCKADGKAGIKDSGLPVQFR